MSQNPANAIAGARNLLSRGIDFLGTNPYAQSAAGLGVGSLAAYGAASLYNAVSPLDVDKEYASGLGGATGALLAGELIKKAIARRSGVKDPGFTQMSIPFQ